MKLLIITLHADPTINPGAEEGGGTHMYVNEIINLLVYKQVDSLVITRKASNGLNNFQYGNVLIKRINIGPATNWDKNNLDKRESDIKHHIYNELKLYDFVPDLVHSIYWHSGRAGVFFSEFFDVPLIHTVISLGARKKEAGYEVSKYRIDIENKIFSKAKVIISVSEQEKQDLIEYYNVPPEKVKVIGRGVDTIFIEHLYNEKGTLISRRSLDIKKFTDYEF